MVFLGLSKFAQRNTGRPAVEICCDLKREITERLGDDEGALREGVGFLRIAGHEEMMAGVD